MSAYQSRFQRSITAAAFDRNESACFAGSESASRGENVKLLLRLAAAAGAALVLLAGGVYLLSEYGGEVVVLRTTDAAEGTRETHLWIVEGAGSAWLRAG